MLALSIRQPFAELILRGIKTVELRSRPTRVIGRRFYIYAAKSGGGSVTRSPAGTTGGGIVADNFEQGIPPPWMIELANALKLFPQELPTGVIVGTAIIACCEPDEALATDAVTPSPGDPRRRARAYGWHLQNVKRLVHPRRPSRHPQPGWFRPF